MTWLLTNGDTTREFATKEEAEAAKTKLAGLGDLSIEKKETETDDSDEIEADYVSMPYDDELGADDDDDNDSGGCPSCGAISDKTYRCDNCGRDLAGVRSGVGTGGMRS